MTGAIATPPVHHSDPLLLHLAVVEAVAEASLFHQRAMPNNLHKQRPQTAAPWDEQMAVGGGGQGLVSASRWAEERNNGAGGCQIKAKPQTRKTHAGKSLDQGNKTAQQKAETRASDDLGMQGVAD